MLEVASGSTMTMRVLVAVRPTLSVCGVVDGVYHAYGLAHSKLMRPRSNGAHCRKSRATI